MPAVPSSVVSSTPLNGGTHCCYTPCHVIVAGAVGLLGGAGVRTVVDSAVVQQRDQLRSEVEALRSRLESLQTATTAALTSKTEVVKQLAQAQATIISKEHELIQMQGALQGEKAATGAAGQAKQAHRAAAAEAAEETRQQLDDLQQQLKARDIQVHIMLYCVNLLPLF